ncbi:translocator protein homolog [Salvia miltiorrhiza]|uniref:translocator protein homolog n=1 Tax=Salvia miltiorrhiza TaxID=226208 RepID=UPI0025ABFCBE|nr:translocator protein homolog [Salvia miltiorrhiza]
MASPDLKHRPIQQQTAPDEDDMNHHHRKKPKNAAAHRGLRSLSVAVALPLSLSVLDIFLFGSSSRYRSLDKPFYVPPLWALHLACVSTAFLSGLSAWLVWAEGGFHRHPAALGLYLGQLALSLVWYPVVFGAGAIRVGLLLCAALFGVLLGCARAFRNMNPIAGDLVKPCLAWALLLAAANVRLVYQ